MPQNATVPEVGSDMPDLQLVGADDTRASLHSVRSGQRAVAYFLRASTCPACVQHSRSIAQLADSGQLADAKVLLIAPGGQAQAQQLAERVPSEHMSIWASGDAHSEAGLGTFLNIQHSGTFLVAADGTVAYRRTAKLPPNSFDRHELLAAIAHSATGRPPRR